MVLLILAVVWALFLVPQVLRARAEKTPADSIGAFRAQLSVLERTGPAVVTDPVRPSMAVPVYRPAGVATREQIRRRRQNILFGLLGTMAVTLFLGLVVPLFFAVHLVLDVMFAGYCALLVRARQLADERAMKVRYLPGRMLTHAEPSLLLSRSGS